MIFALISNKRVEFWYLTWYKVCINERETIEHFILNCQKYGNFRNALFNDLANLDIDQNRINLQLLLTGEGSDKFRIHILKLFINFVKLTNRFGI